MCLTYNIGSRKTRSKNAIYHRLTKLSNSTPLRTQCAWDPQEDLTGVVTWAEKDLRKRSGLINLGNAKLHSQTTKEQPTRHQETYKSANTPNNKYKGHAPVNQVENLLTKEEHKIFACPLPITHSMFFVFSSFLFSFFLTWFFFFFPFLSRFRKWNRSFNYWKP